MKKTLESIYYDTGDDAVKAAKPGGTVVTLWPQAGGEGGLSVTGTGFVHATSDVIDGAATANVRYAGGKLQIDTNLQWKAGAIFGDLAWTPTGSNKTITLPDATGQVVLRDTSDTLTNKTISADANTITAVGAALGDLLYYNGSKFVRLARGSVNQVLSSTGSSIQWVTISGSLPGGAVNGQFLGWQSGAATWTNAANYVGLAFTGQIPAGQGHVRLPNSGTIFARNVANSADMCMLASNAGNELMVGGSGPTANLFENTRLLASTYMYLGIGGTTQMWLGANNVQITPGGSTTALYASNAGLGVGVPFGGILSALRLKVATVNIPISSDTLLTSAQAECPVLRITWPGGTSDTWSVNLLPNVAGAFYLIHNDSGRTAYVRRSGGGTLHTFSSGQTKLLFHDGGDYRAVP